jgi:hypothetical protein
VGELVDEVRDAVAGGRVARLGEALTELRGGVVEDLREAVGGADVAEVLV